MLLYLFFILHFTQIKKLNKMNLRSSIAKDAPTYSQVANPAITSYQVLDNAVDDDLVEAPVNDFDLPVDCFEAPPSPNESGPSQVVTPDSSFEHPTRANSVDLFESASAGMIDLANVIGSEEQEDQLAPFSTNPPPPQQQEKPAPQDEVATLVPTDLSAAVAEAQSCGQSAGMRIAAGSSIHSAGYCNKKKIVIRNFIEGLRAAAPKYNAFLKPPAYVPEYFTYSPAEAVFVLLSPYEKDKRKKVKILNEMLIDWVNGMVKTHTRKKKKASANWHSPATISTIVRSFLAATKEFFGWEFLVSDFKFIGGFNAFFKQLVEERRKIDVSDGR